MPLTKHQKEQLEVAALSAFTGRSDKLVHGFRIQTPRGQVAAIYWGDVHAGNEVEIALAEGRLTERYDLVTVQGWLQWKKELHPRPCNTHMHGSDWPIIGFDFDEAIDFLKECRSLRIGFLPNDVKLGLDARMRSRSPEQEREAQLKAELEALRPTRKQAVIDLVYRAGVSIAPWYIRQDGSAATTPRSNPAYCYNWAFGGGNEPTLVCLWHKSLGIHQGHIEVRSNIRDLAQKLESVAVDGAEPQENRDRARAQATRARQMDSLLSVAAETGRPLRAIINEGDIRDESRLGQESSIVRIRHLDPVEWLITDYDGNSGAFVMRRDAVAATSKTGPVISELEPDLERYADQFDIAGTDQPVSKHASGQVYLRDRAVRAMVLERAKGCCEYCGVAGFLMGDGRLYVETHHVTPLAEGGADRVWNVAALCPTHHREAHCGAEADTLRLQLKEMLARIYPADAVAAASLVQATGLNQPPVQEGS